MQPQIPLEDNKKYVGYSIDTHDCVYKKASNLALPEIQGMWYEYEHQFKNKDVPKIQRVKAWIGLQVYTEILRERNGWDNNSRRPSIYTEASPGYAAKDFYTNPDYGWCE
jgi:hypothetical protein